MRVVAAMMKHETNTFSPVATPLERFESGGPKYGKAAYDGYKGTGTGLGAFIDMAEAAGAEVVTPVAAEAWPSAHVEDAAFETLANAIAEEVDKGCDAVLLDLHGAMVTQSHEDGEGELIARLRKIAPQTPIAVSLDMHANVTQKIVGNATTVSGFQTYPHIDLYETGVRAARPVFDLIAGTSRPTMCWGNRPMLPHVMRQGTDDSPMKELQARCQEMEASGKALSASLFSGFPHADIHDAGLSAVVVTEHDIGEAELLCAELLNQAWDARDAFVYQIEPLEQSLGRAKDLGADQAGGPVVLLDHFDNTGSGGSMDTTRVLAGILEAGLEDVAFFGIYDPAAVKAMIEAGVGAQVTLSLGGKYDLPSIGHKGEPLTVSGRVKTISDGRYTIKGPMYTGVTVSMGRTAVIDTGKVEIVVVEHHHEPWDVGCLESLGIDPVAKRYVALKSRVHYRAGFKPIAKAIVECAGVGVCTSDYSQLTFNNVRRPIYPLDLINEAAPLG